MTSNPFILGTVFMPVFGAVVALLFVRYNRVQRWIGFGAALLAWAFSLVLLIQTLAYGVQTYRMGGWQPPFGIVLVSDPLSALFGVMCTTVLMAGFMYTLHCRDKCVTYPTFLPLFLCMATGLSGAMFTGDLFTYFVFMELMVLSSVSLTAMSDDRLGVEAAMKYLFISGMGSLFVLMGVCAMYATLGTLNMADMAVQLASGDRPLLARGAAVMLVASFLLKSAVFPFHFWQPDFHTTAPTPVHAVLSSVVVKVGIYGVIRVTTLLFPIEAPQLQALLVILGLIGMFFGGLSALRTYNGKRLLAYSTIGQIGFILVALGWGSPLALAAAIIFAFNHALIKAALLMIMGLLSSRLDPKTADFADIGGVGRKMPAIIGVLWFLGGMALAGVPPMNGFISKLAVVQSGIAAEQWAVVFLAVGAGLITLIYMFRTWQYVFQQENPDSTLKIKDYGDSVLAPVLLIGLCLLLGLYARPLILVAEYAVSYLNNPKLYIDAIGLWKG